MTLRGPWGVQDSARVRAGATSGEPPERLAQLGRGPRGGVRQSPPSFPCPLPLPWPGGWTAVVTVTVLPAGT